MRWRIKEALKYPAVTLASEHIQLVGQGFAEVVVRTGCIIYACAIMPDHVHLVIERHRYSIEQLVILLKGGASDFLRNRGKHPQQKYIGKDCKLPKTWEKGSWNVFLNGAEMVQDKIDYTNVNPIRAGCRRRNGDLSHLTNRNDWV